MIYFLSFCVLLHVFFHQRARRCKKLLNVFFVIPEKSLLLFYIFFFLAPTLPALPHSSPPSFIPSPSLPLTLPPSAFPILQLRQYVVVVCSVCNGGTRVDYFSALICFSYKFTKRGRILNNVTLYLFHYLLFNDCGILKENIYVCLIFVFNIGKTRSKC